MADTYEHIRSGGSGYCEQKRGLIAVWGKEAVQFLDGLISNDMKTLEDGAEMLAAFPNAQGRLLAVVRVLRQGDRYLFETEEATREKVFQNLFRFTFAGDFFVEDLSDQYQFFRLYGEFDLLSIFVLGMSTDEPIVFEGRTIDIFVLTATVDVFRNSLVELKALLISTELAETLRIEDGQPVYGIDMDETTIVPELGLDGLISYNKGCYIGQEIIARIHFRGHVAKRLTGLMSEPGAIATGFLPGAELTTEDGKNAGRITSATYSTKLDKNIALAYVRYDHLASGTELKAGDVSVTVTDLPFIS
ncbi:MAG: glycine cleavage T C-terminal barrel domain-containing protein [Pyrinomonadaceae bacterium]